jgi:hypothetical protein
VAGFTSFAQNAQAELITINIRSFGIDGPNGGVSDGGFTSVFNFPIIGDTLYILNKAQVGPLVSDIGTGLESDGLRFATGTNSATPVNFSLGASIGNGPTYEGFVKTLFEFSPSVSPDFGPGSYMGFKTSQNNYGWLEVTWDSASQDFQIFSGAYESTPNVAILAGAGGAAPIPEPGTWAAMAIFAGGAAFAGWRRRNSAKVAA